MKEKKLKQEYGLLAEAWLRDIELCLPVIPESEKLVNKLAIDVHHSLVHPEFHLMMDLLPLIEELMVLEAKNLGAPDMVKIVRLKRFIEAIPRRYFSSLENRDSVS